MRIMGGKSNAFVTKMASTKRQQSVRALRAICRLVLYAHNTPNTLSTPRLCACAGRFVCALARAYVMYVIHTLTQRHLRA